MTKPAMKTAKTSTRKPVQKSATKSAQNRNEKTNAKSSTRSNASSNASSAASSASPGRVLKALDDLSREIAYQLADLHRTYATRVQSLVRDWQAAIDNASAIGADVGSFAPVRMCATCLDVPAVIPIAGTYPNLPPLWCSYICAAEHAIGAAEYAAGMVSSMGGSSTGGASVRDVLTGNTRLVMYSTRDLEEADRRRASEIRHAKYERQQRQQRQRQQSKVRR